MGVSAGPDVQLLLKCTMRWLETSGQRTSQSSSQLASTGDRRVRGMASHSLKEGRLERTVQLRIGEVKNLPAPRDIRQKERDGRDCYVVVALDREEIFRTATAEHSLSPFFGEEFSFLVPRDFRQLSFYVITSESLPLPRDIKLGKVAIDKSTLLANNVLQDQWYTTQPIDVNSEVQGKIHLCFNYRELFDTDKSHYELSVKAVECCGLCGLGPNGFADPYCQVVVLGPSEPLSEVRRGLVHRKTNDPHFNETFKFPLEMKELRNAIVRVSVWHHSSLSEPTFLGQVNISTSAINTSRAYHGWFQLSPRPPSGQPLDQERLDLGSMRLMVRYSQDIVYPLDVYGPLQTLLLQSLEAEEISDSALHILSEVSQDRVAMARSLVKIFLKLGSLEHLLNRLIQYEVSMTSDPNTLFRGNSVVSKLVDEFMKFVGLSYLHRTLQCLVDEIFELKRSCEIDPSKLEEGESIDVNMTNLMFYVERVLSAVCSSARSCPRTMCSVFAMLSQAAVRRFPEQHNIVQYTAVSGFIFLRFFAPAILNPRLFQLRSEIPSPQVARTLTLISKTIQNMGNITNLINKGNSTHPHKEDFMAPLNRQLMDESHIRDIKTYLAAVADRTGGEVVGVGDMVHREGFLVKRSQGRRNGLKNFRKRYFILTGKALSYAKTKQDAPLCIIPSSDLLAVERVDDQAFNMKFMFQIIQPSRILYVQAKNSVELKEWLSVLARVCGHNDHRLERYHSGSFLNSQWTCCGSMKDYPACTSGCKPISLAVQIMASRGDVDLERELHKVYRMFLDGQSNLIKLKDEATCSARSSSTLSLRVQNLCELLIFVKNLELMSTFEPSPPLGTKNAPYFCPVDRALVLR